MTANLGDMIKTFLYFLIFLWVGDVQGALVSDRVAAAAPLRRTLERGSKGAQPLYTQCQKMVRTPPVDHTF